MKVKLGASVTICLTLAVIFAFVVVIAPDAVSRRSFRRTEGFLAPSWYQASPDGAWYALGTDYLGRPFVPVLCQAASATMRIALLGTAAALLGLSGRRGGSRLDTFARPGSSRRRGKPGVMAVPEAAVVITLATAWPRTAPALYVNGSILAVLVAFAVPTGARLIAERVRAVGRTGFVAASRGYGATYSYTFRHEIWLHLHEDLAWIVASVLPRFVAVEIGMAYLGVEYRDFEGLGRVLTKSFNNLVVGTAVFQMLITIVVIVGVALLPQIILRSLGIRPSREFAP